MAVILGAIAIVPAMAADATGTIKLSKSYVSPTGEATITVDDADLNTTSSVYQHVAFADTDTANTVAVAGTEIFFTLALSAGEEILGTPELSVSGASITAGTAANFAVTVFNAASGSISIENNLASRASLTVDYKKASKQETTATVTGPNAPTGISVTLTETKVDSGKFEGKFKIATETVDMNQDRIQAVAGQIMTIKYTDAAPSGKRTVSLTIEDTKPVGAIVSPAHKSSTTSLVPKLIVDFTDLDSAVDQGTATIVIASASTTGDVDDSVTLDTVSTSAITNGYRVEQAVASGSVTDSVTVVIMWHGLATDKAGNVGQSDSDPAVTGSQNYKLIIDRKAPDWANADVFAGRWFDEADNDVEDKVTKSKNNIIAIKFDDVFASAGTVNDLEETLNSGTISAADFIVDDVKQADGTELDNVTPSAVNIFDKAQNYIFLTVPEMAPNATPKVTLKTTSGGISDLAGNSTSAEASLTAADSQAPTVTYSLNRTLDDGDATVTITTNETGGTPVVKANKVAQTVTLTATNTYESKISPTDGVWSLEIAVSDSASNTTTLGNATPTTDSPTSSDILIYIDDALPAAAVKANGSTVAAGGAFADLKLEESVPFFLTADWASEGKEYGLHGEQHLMSMVLATASAVTDDLDVHATVTIGTATLDGVDIIGLVDTQDNKSFTLAVLDMATGDHTFVLGGKDEAGNVLDRTYKFNVTARKAFELTVAAGWNLISFPGTPIASAIDTVIPVAHPATNALTFAGGEWLVAQRSVGATWEGTLTTIDGNHAYWLNTSSSEPVKALLGLTSVGTAATLPSIAVTAGWNLVPVIDLAQTKIGAQGSTKTADAYFTSVSWSVAYTYNASTRVWTRHTTTSGNLENGQGVWVWANRAGTLIP
jgi:hypothetical protein